MDANRFITVEEKERREQLKGLRASLRAEIDEQGLPQVRKIVDIKFPKGKVIQLEARAPGYDDMMFVNETGFPSMAEVEIGGREEPEEAVEGETEALVVEGEEAPRKVKPMKMRPRLFFPAMIAVTFYVPGTNDRVWENDELAVIGRLDPSVFNQLKDIAMEMSGSSKDSQDELEGNSDSESTTG